MKKTIAITLILLSLLSALLISCTQNATEGIYKQVVTQGASAKYKIKQYIGFINDKHYFIDVTGVCENSKCIISGNFASAYLYDKANAKVLLLDTNGKITSHSLISKPSESTPINKDTTFGNLTPNGFATSDSNGVKYLYRFNGDKFEPMDLSALSDPVLKILWSGENILIQTNSSDDYEGLRSFIYEDNQFREIADLKDIQVLGFQKTVENNYYVMSLDSSDNYKYFKLVTSGSAPKCSQVGEKEASTPLSNVSQVPSYYDKVNKKTVFRCSSYYDVLSDDEIEIGVSGGFATSIHTATMEVVNMVPLDDSQGNAIIAFYKYGLFKANVNNNPATSEIKF